MLTESILIAIVLALLVSSWATLALMCRTLRMPTAEQAIPGKRPWYIRLLPWAPTVSRILEDIERVKQSELDHQTRYQIVTDNVAAAVVMHQADGSVLWCSSYAEVLTGFSVAEIYKDRAQFLKRHVHEDDRARVDKSLAIVATGEAYQCRYRFYHKSGITVWLEMRTVPVFDHAANEYVALSVALDVTASVLSQMKIEERNRDLSEFTYMISHDLKAQIITLQGMFEIVQEQQLQVETNLAEPLEFMSKAIHRLEQLVVGVLDLARVSAVDKALEPVSVEETVQEVVDNLRFEIEQSEAQITTVSELPWVLGNKIQLYQIVSNIVANAIKYRKSERPLIIAIEAAPTASRRRVSFAIRDNGRGIAADQVEHVFKPFHRAGEESSEGSGVGLACAKRLVEKIGGTISVSSAPDTGSVFTIELRRAPDQ